MACGELGPGRMAEPPEIVAAIERCQFGSRARAADRSPGATCWSPPARRTSRSIPVRYIANRSSGKQGHAIAARRRGAGAEVTLVTGPVDAAATRRRARGQGRDRARDACRDARGALPADIAIFAAAVADWRVADAGAHKIKKQDQAGEPR